MSARTVFSVRRRTVAAITLFTWACVSLPLSEAAGDFEPTFTPLVVTGTPAPGVPDQGDFSGFADLAINASGQAFIRARATVDPGRGFWGLSSLDGELQPIVAIGQPAPGVPDATFRGTTNQVTPITDAGGFAQLMFVEGPNVPDDFTVPGDAGIWAANVDGSLNLVAFEGQAAPGAGANYGFLGVPVAARDGSLAFNAQLDESLSGSGNFRDAIFTVPQAGATPILYANQGDAAPGLPAGVTLASLRPNAISKNGFAFLSNLAGPGVDDSNDFALYFDALTSGNPQLVARTGDTPSGFEPGNTIRSVFAQQIFDDGSIVYGISFSLPGEIIASETAVYRLTPGEAPSLLLQNDGNIPGLPDEFTIGRASIDATNATGGLVITARASDEGDDSSNDFAIAIGDVDGDFKVIAREGDNLPANFSRGRFFLINGRGQVAFTGSADGKSLLFATLPDGELVELLASGDLVDINGEMKTVDLLDQLGFATRGSFDSFTDDGTLGFVARFEDGTDAILTTQVPEPGTLVLAAMVAAGGLLSRPRGRR